MKKIVDLIIEELKPAFTGCGYDEKFIRVTLSNRPDLCEYQCNGAMAAAKAYKKKPIDIANELVEQLKDSSMFSEINAVMPGFINIRLNPEYLAGYVNRMASDEKYGLEEAKDPETIIVDYGGANVAKPLHVGHLALAVIGESIKRISRYMGHKTSDVHLGDWGLQMGLIIEELHDRQPELPYFDETFLGNTRRKRRLRYQSWRRSIRQPAQKRRKRQKQARRSRRGLRRPPLSFRTATSHTGPFGTIS